MHWAVLTLNLRPVPKGTIKDFPYPSLGKVRSNLGITPIVFMIRREYHWYMKLGWKRNAAARWNMTGWRISEGHRINQKILMRMKVRRENSLKFHGQKKMKPQGEAEEVGR
jgi:hypothetical protein